MPFSWLLDVHPEWRDMNEQPGKPLFPLMPLYWSSFLKDVGAGTCQRLKSGLYELSQFLHSFISPKQWTDIDLFLSTSSLSLLLRWRMPTTCHQSQHCSSCKLFLICSRQKSARLVYTMWTVVWANWGGFAWKRLGSVHVHCSDVSALRLQHLAWWAAWVSSANTTGFRKGVCSFTLL